MINILKQLLAGVATIFTGRGRIRYVCNHCGGTDLVFSANSYWNEETQEWDHEEDEGKPYCNGCECETSFHNEVI